MGDTTATTDPAQKKEELATEAAELVTDIKETEQEVKEARAAGDDARVTRLETSLTEAKKDLGEIKTLLVELKDRPFHPAPGDGETPPAAPVGEENKDGQEQAATPPEDKPKKKHWLYGD